MNLDQAKRICDACDAAIPFLESAAKKFHDEEARIFYGEKPMTNERVVYSGTKTPIPTGARVLLMKGAAAETTEGGIVIPDNAREQPLTAHILAVGEKVESLRKGDEVIFASYAGTTFTIDGKEVIVVDEEDIMLVLREVPCDN